MSVKSVLMFCLWMEDSNYMRQYMSKSSGIKTLVEYILHIWWGCLQNGLMLSSFNSLRRFSSEFHQIPPALCLHWFAPSQCFSLMLLLRVIKGKIILRFWCFGRTINKKKKKKWRGSPDEGKGQLIAMEGRCKAIHWNSSFLVYGRRGCTMQ